MSSSPEAIIALLGLRKHPEGGHYRETFRDPGGSGGRAASTAIYYLLQAHERSAWHRIDAAETWHHYAGGPLRLHIARETVILGKDLAAGERPQAVVPAGVWQSAEPMGGWVLLGCTVAPGFEFERFEMAPPGFQPE